MLKFALSLSLLLSLFGCKVSEAANPPPSPLPPFKKTPQILSNSELEQTIDGKVLTLNFKQNTHYEDLELRLIALEDSRCAIGVSCIWAGQLVVTLQVTYKLDKPIILSLSRQPSRKPVIAKSNGYIFRLLTVDPHPKKGKILTLNDRIIKIEVAKDNINTNDSPSQLQR